MACDASLMRWGRSKASRREVFLLALLLGLPLVLNAEPPPPLKLVEQLVGFGYERIELRRTAENHLYLVGKLNGHRRGVLVDTGWSLTTVSMNTAPKLLPSRDGGTNEYSHVLIKRLTLGHASFTNQPALVQNMVYDGQATPFEVVLGCDFLRRHFAIVDCLNRRLYVRPRALAEEEQTKLERDFSGDGFRAVALTLKQPLAITCSAWVNGKPVEMLVDTGAVWSTLDVRQLDRLGLRALPTLTRISGVGKTGTHGVAVGEAKSFVLGDVPVKDTNFALMDLRSWGLAAPGEKLGEVQGILGGSELVANSALIDCHRLKLWVKRGNAKK
jgi:predicted aspartyl protease